MQLKVTLENANVFPLLFQILVWLPSVLRINATLFEVIYEAQHDLSPLSGIISPTLFPEPSLRISLVLHFLLPLARTH